ncbi:MAG TPA: alpha/beta fold hydrolase [Sphingomicrobium sp.]|nr:alpha/beta fold hydrolase [Sphingomicrobium sp.]
MPRIATPLGAIGYAEEGSGGTPLIFLHGVGSDKSVWRRQLQHFGPMRRTIAFDYPGYADSDPAPPGTTRDDYAIAVLAGMDDLGIARAHLCGLSLGGVIAIAIHAAAPDRCASLVIADSFSAHPGGPAIYERSLASSSDMRALAEGRADVLLAQPADPAIRKEVVETMARIDPAALSIGAEAVWLANQRARVSAIRVPTLVVVGVADEVTPPALSEELAGAIPGAELQVIAGAGHLTNIEKPEAFNQLVEDFVRRVETRPAN